MSSLEGLQDVITLFHLEKLKDLTCAQEYAVTVSNQFGMLDALEDLVKLWDTLKCKTLEAGKGVPKVTEWLPFSRDVGLY